MPPDDPDAPDPGALTARVMDGALWDDLLETLDESRRLVLGPDVPDGPEDRAEGFRYLLRFLAAGINFCVEHADGDFPELTRMMDRNMRWGLDHPDCLYLVSALNGQSAYRVYGDPGSANWLDVQANEGHYADGSVGAVRTVGSAARDDLALGPDGSVELFLGGAERAHNWLPLSSDVQFLQIRQYFADWSHERPADLRIEKLGGAAARPRPQPERFARDVERLRSWLREGGALWENMSKVMLAIPKNTLRIAQMDQSAQHSGLRGQAYGMGNFACGPDEAVILEFDPPGGRHWCVNLSTWWWEAIDFGTRAASLNHHQGAIDSDGRFRAVIAHRDPGIANWLDAAGHARGTLTARFLMPETLPEPESRVVKWDELETALPRDTPRIDAAARTQMLNERREGVWRRYRR